MSENPTPEAVAASLTSLEVERITGWQGPAGAAFNVISESLCDMGLLNADWSLSERGLAVRQALTGESA